MESLWMPVSSHTVAASGLGFGGLVLAQATQSPSVTWGAVCLAGFGFGSVYFGYRKAIVDRDARLTTLVAEIVELKSQVAILHRRLGDDSADFPPVARRRDQHPPDRP